MHNRFSLKIVGRSGQGVNVLGEMLAKGLKRSGYYVFGYREYPSLIQGGHSTYQIDISNSPVLSSTKKIDLLVVLNKQGTQWHQDELNPNSYIIHDIDNPRINDSEYKSLKSLNTKLIYIPGFQLSKEQGGNELTANMVLLGSIWNLLGLEHKKLIEIVKDTFKDKPKLLEIDLSCANIGFEYKYNLNLPLTRRVLKPLEVSDEQKVELHYSNFANLKMIKFASHYHQTDSYLMSGNESISLGAINSGVRIFYSYPMTPTSSIMTVLSEYAPESGIIVKQAEDEITAAAMAIGSMHMGTRALTATSGGGFDLMTEHLSLSAMIEVPFVVVLGQRPGPATGLPTWTTQGDLMLSIFSGHGEFSRCVIAVKDAQDSFYAIQEAMNIADEYQIPVVVLTDKLVAESIYQVPQLDTNKIQISRGKLILDTNKASQLLSSDRYQFTQDGISLRWLPGTKAHDFNANSDEHDQEGNVTEDAEMAYKMIQKRLLKEQTLLSRLPKPELFKNKANGKQNIKIVSWGSNFGVVQDAMRELEKENICVENLHFKYVWPLKTEELEKFVDENTIIIETNHNGQFAQLIRMQTGLNFKHKILKWDGRPFFVDDLINQIKSKLTSPDKIMVKSAGGLVRNSAGKFILVSQSSTSVTIPKGHVEEGETNLEAAKREIFEETGIKDLRLIKSMGTITRIAGDNPNKIKNIEVFLFETSEKLLNPKEERVKAEWVSYEELLNKLTYKEDQEFFKTLTQKI